MTTMLSVKGLSVVCGCALILLSVTSSTEAAHWSYESLNGPDHWAEHYPDCAGRSQSPIDILTFQTCYDDISLDNIILTKEPPHGSAFYVHNNGHTIQIDVEGEYLGKGGLRDIYNTKQLHFHWGDNENHGSEHTINGKTFPLEMHIVNWDVEKYRSFDEAKTEPEGLAVLSILFEISEKDNPILEPLLKVLPDVKYPDLNNKVAIASKSMRTFLPRALDRYYRYHGSLTTPGCFESVVWTIFEEKQTISRRQLNVFQQTLKSTYKTLVNNDRPVQPLNGRIVYRSFPFL